MSPTPRDLIEHVMRHQIDENQAFDHLADDVVVETPFAPGDRNRIEGKAAFLPIAEAGRATLPVRFDEVANLVVHETTDPEVVIAEYTITGTWLDTDTRASADFITVVRVRDGLVVHWREYQDGLAMAAAFGPALG